MIVKFTSWESRTAVYRARKEQDKVKIFMDLTPRRSKLLSDAKSKANSDPNIDFAIADINCRLGFKLKDGSFKFFNSRGVYSGFGVNVWVRCKTQIKGICLVP